MSSVTVARMPAAARAKVWWDGVCAGLFPSHELCQLNTPSVPGAHGASSECTGSPSEGGRDAGQEPCLTRTRSGRFSEANGRPP